MTPSSAPLTPQLQQQHLRFQPRYGSRHLTVTFHHVLFLLCCVCFICSATPDGPITSPLDAAAASSNRDALVKVMYSRVFDWLVSRINASIGQDPAAFASIGLLDIYGFESFTFNDLEQVGGKVWACMSV
jgi:hypothetical protein